MNKFTGILAFILILAITNAATSEQVVTKEMIGMDGMPLEEAINFTKP